MSSIKPKSKQGYLNFDQIQAYIDSGKLDQYDVIYAIDRKTWNIIDKDLNIVPIISRIDNYQSEEDAVNAINNRTDTYSGQIINVFIDGKYIPYVVNEDENNIFYITCVSTSADDYNYDSLYNKPIENIVADVEVILSELDNGAYTLLGNYRLCDVDITHRSTAIKKYFIIEHDIENGDNVTFITEISGKNTLRYSCYDDRFIEDRYVLASELGNEVEDILDEELPGRIDDYIQNNQASQQDIDNLFP